MLYTDSAADGREWTDAERAAADAATPAAQVAAAEQHPDTLPPEQMPVHRVRFFDKPCPLYYAGKNATAPEAIGEVEITYSAQGYRAIYGFTADGRVSLWAN
jgi:hypothetical protein